MIESVKNWVLSVRLFVCNALIARVPFHSLRLWFYRRIMNASIGRGSSIHLGAYLDAVGGLSIGANSTVNRQCRLDSRGGLIIGDNVTVAADAIILTADHDIHSATFDGRLRAVHVGDYVFIGTRATILPGVSLGRGAVIAAGAVVTRDVAAGRVVAGVPAREIGDRTVTLTYSAAYRRPLF